MMEKYWDSIKRPHHIIPNIITFYKVFGIHATTIVYAYATYNHELFYELVKRQLLRRFPSLNTIECDYSDDVANTGPIWIMWWQGLGSATPEIVQRCIDSIKRHANNRSIHIITSENYQEFIDIPSPIIAKVSSGKLSLTAFSDYVRCKLLFSLRH